MNKNIHQLSLSESESVVVNLKSADAKEFSRVLGLINSFEDYTQLVIQGSKISQPLTDSGIFLETDLSKLIGPNVNMDVMLKRDDLKKIKQLIVAGGISIVYSPDDQRYIFHSDHHHECLVEIGAEEDKVSPSPVFDEENYLGSEVAIADVENLKRYIGKSSITFLFVYQNQLEQIQTMNQETAPYTLKATGAGSLNGKKPDQIFICSNFLTIAGKKTSLRIGIKNESWWLITETRLSSKVDKVKVFYPLECLEK